jgi:hypothetical protein
LLIPAAPLAAMAVGFVICRAPRSSFVAVPLVVAHLVTSWPSINNQWKISSGWRISQHIPWSAALRIEPEELYLKRSDAYLIAQMIETHVPDGRYVLVFTDDVAQSYTTRPILIAWASALGERMTDLIQQAGISPAYSRTWTVHFAPTRVAELRIVQHGDSGPNTMWSINEIRLWNTQNEIIPRASWQLNAQPNRWDVPLLMDGLEVTRWRSWEALRRGMWIDVRLNPPEMVDRADIEYDDSQWDSQMEMSVRDDGGQWHGAGPSSWHVSRFPDSRREATRVLKQAGIQYLEVNRDAWNQQPFYGDFTGWGVRLLAATPHSLLLEID